MQAYTTRDIKVTEEARNDSPNNHYGNQLASENQGAGYRMPRSGRHYRKFDVAYTGNDGFISMPEFRSSGEWMMLEVTGKMNPNVSGNGNYGDPIHMPVTILLELFFVNDGVSTQR